MARPQSGCAGPLLSGSQYPEHRRAADAELTGNFRWTDTSSMELLHLVSLHPCCRRSAPVLPLGLGVGDADKHALSNQLSLELRDDVAEVGDAAGKPV